MTKRKEKTSDLFFSQTNDVIFGIVVKVGQKFRYFADCYKIYNQIINISHNIRPCVVELRVHSRKGPEIGYETISRTE